MLDPLSSSFNSWYRLTLRALSASVRHHPTAARNLRRLFRPSFREAAKTIKSHVETPSRENEEWLKIWNQKLDKTLALLYSSATTAGIPRDLVRNISLLTDIYHVRAWADKQASRRAAGVWNGLKPPPVEPEKKRKEQPISSRERIQLSAWSALGELVCATETDIGIMAGRQEQMSYGFTRKTMYRPSFPLKKTHLRLYNIVGRSDARPRDLKAGRTLVPSSPLVP